MSKSLADAAFYINRRLPNPVSYEQLRQCVLMGKVAASKLPNGRYSMTSAQTDAAIEFFQAVKPD